MSKLKLVSIIVTICSFLGLGCVTTIQHNQLKKLKTEIVIADNNYLALSNENSDLKDKTFVYQLTINQLTSSNDSLIKEMNKVRRELKVKDKELKELAYLASIATKTDTVYLKEDIIKIESSIDTVIQDDWYKLYLSLSPPNELVITPEYKSEKYVVTYLRKEVLNPSKCKLINWFKKKENIVEIEVVEKNPYIINTKEKFIQKIEK